MSPRRRIIAVLLATALAGLCFEPVFGGRPLVVPVVAVCLTAYAVTELCRYRPGLVIWRPLLVATAGLVAVVETVLRSTTTAGLPTLESARALGRGLGSWRLTLESTWPARPEAALILFVPLLVLLAAMLGLELLDRTRPLVAFVPTLAVTGLSQAYVALTGLNAVLVAALFAAFLALVLVSGPAPARRSLSPLVPLAVLTVIGLLSGYLLSVLDPAGRTPYTLQQTQAAQTPTRLTSPLAELAGRLDPANRGTELFKYRSAGPVGRWRQVALDDFDGANWTTDHPFLRLGSELSLGPEITTATTRQQATLELTGLTGPWLPGQLLPLSVSGAAEPQVEPIGGTLVAADRPDSYSLTWAKPAVDARRLLASGMDPDAIGGLGDLGAVPTEISALAEEALGGRRPTFQTALALERYLRQNYKLAVSAPLPTGHSWPQLRRFLVEDKIGTSEQFAAAYVALARLSGIPARLVVGFRAPASAGPDGWYTVRNADAFAWPEVAVDGVGWWPLDPAGQAERGRPVIPGSDTDVTDQARAELPPSNEIQDPALPPPEPEEDPGRSWMPVDLPRSLLVLLVAVPLLGWLFGVPLVKFARAVRRRRRTGSATVVGAWAEARDRLCDHGVGVTAGMTVRDLAVAAAEVADDRARSGLATVARSVDQALWSGLPVNGETGREAWSGVREVRRGLRSRPWPDRVRAALQPRSLWRR